MPITPGDPQNFTGAFREITRAAATEPRPETLLPRIDEEVADFDETLDEDEETIEDETAPFVIPSSDTIEHIARVRESINGGVRFSAGMRASPTIANPTEASRFRVPSGYYEQCAHCQRKPTPSTNHAFEWADGMLWCLKCFIPRSFLCVHCKNPFIDGIKVGYTYVDERDGVSRHKKTCRDCAKDRYASCVKCRNVYAKNSFDASSFMNGHCMKCVEHLCEELTWRPYAKIPTISDGKEGKTAISMRPFGVELEVQYRKRQEAGLAYVNLPHEVGVVRDGSISGPGFEIQTPPAAGNKAEEMIRGICATLQKYNFSFDKSCGMHVHIDVNDINGRPSSEAAEDVRDLWLFYISFEDVIQSFLPESRRGGSSQADRYCRGLKKDYHFDEILRARNMDHLEKLWYRLRTTPEVNEAKGEHRHATRYRGINLHPLFSGRHLEIRYHSGTLNPRKILEWANLHATIADHIFGRGIDTGWLQRMHDMSRLDTKTDEFLAFLDLTPESEGYFRARQETFYVPPNFKKTDATKSGAEVLKEEKEN